MNDQILTSWPQEKTIVEIFANQVTHTPDRVAVVFKDQNLTYRGLHEQSNQLASFLIAKGVKRETLIPICLDRSLEMIIGILGILKAGVAYVPIDPGYPEDRIGYMLDDTKASLVLSNSLYKQKLSSIGNIEIIELDQDWKDIAKQVKGNLDFFPLPKDLAYVIYTSGSTGKPKGVMVEHHSLICYLLNSKASYINDQINSSGTFFHLSYTFDGSVTSIFMPLMWGKSIVLQASGNHEIFADGYFKKNAAYDFIKLTPAHMPLLQMAVKGKLENITKRLVLGGEALKWGHIKYLVEEGSDIEIVNEYGPTEATVGCCVFRFRTGLIDRMDIIPIGKPLENVSLYILDKNNQPVKGNETGELFIGGPQLARGYLNNPELTGEKFVPDPFAKVAGARMYKTGDLVRWLPDGNIEYLGRQDDQVKIRGYRIELGEVENVLQECPGIDQSVVLAKEDTSGEKNLYAYVVAKGLYDKTATISFLKAKLPEYMIPNRIISVNAMPLTSNGKIDKKALLAMDLSQLLGNEYVAASNKTEIAIIPIFEKLLQLEKFGVNDNFFEFGGNSILAVKAVALLKENGFDLPITKLYQYPTISGIAQYLDGESKSKPTKKKRAVTKSDGDIAVIAMSGRFPGANNIEELWELLREGKESTSFFKKEELDPFIPQSVSDDPDYVKARGVIDDANKFDAAFFKISPKIAQVMDPQHRIFLEISWEVLEKSGHFPETYDGAIGVFAGTGNNTYFLNNVQGHKQLMETIGVFNVMIFNEKDYVASRTAYELDLKGPAVSVYSACSTSLLAISQAVQSIRNGQCDIALAGGASVTVPINSGHIYQEGAMLSRDGHCRSFDAEAGGTVFSDGAGVVLLKRREEAEKDGDTIYAIIKGVGLNNDGGGKGSFTAPSTEGQAGAIVMAIEDSGVSPATITYVETHGTATPIGDPIEIEGLKMAFGHQPQKQYCAIGSIKSNMGHLTAAAGVAGFIKTVLSLHHKKLLPSINFNKPNPNIDFENSPFIVNTTFRDWKVNGTRRAGVSAFGVGGTNVHVVLEEFENKKEETSSSRPVQLINWSAKTLSSREAYSKKLAHYLEVNKDINIADIAFSLQTMRKDFNARRFLIASDRGELLEKLKNATVLPTESLELKESFDDVVFSFPGQGAQYLNMGVDLYKHEIVFKEAVDKCSGILQKILKLDIRDIIYPKENGIKAEENINNTFFTQPAIFVIEYAVAKLWMSWGIKPSAFIGHSIGEFVAAHLAGVFSLEDGLNLIATRGRMMSELPRGSMLAVRADYEQIKSVLSNDLSLAAVNSPGSCVIAGPLQSIDGFAKQLSASNISSKLLATSHAFHSSMMDPIVAPFEQLVKSLKLNLPSTPIVSTVTGKWMTDAEATDPRYWASHLRSTVRFSDAVATFFENGKWLFLETGPRNITASLIRQQAKKVTVAISSLEPMEGQSEYYSLLKAVGQLWLNGIEIDWEAFYSGQKRARLNLPTYAFDPTVFWLDPIESNRPSKMVEAISNESPMMAASLTESINSVNPKNTVMRKDVLIKKIKEVLEDASGAEMDSVTNDMNFIEMGFDSLLLTQVALNLKKEFKQPITFRQLNEEYSTLHSLSAFLDANLPKGQYEQIEQQPVDGVAHSMQNTSIQEASPSNVNAIGLISQQIQLLSQQIALMQGNGNAVPNTIPNTTKLTVAKNISEPEVTAEELVELKKPFGATAKIERLSTQLSPKQQAFVENLTQRYTTKTKGSKNYTQEHRSYTADPRVVSGFRPATKELVYSVVANRSKGSRIWDIDGNEYIDALNGFGSNFFGYQPDMITKAIKDQIDKGYEIGPQHELAGPVSKLICEFTGFDRVGLCNTGSEAVLGAMRISRTVTGRSIIVAFAGSYHGIVDEVIVRGTKKLKSFPAAPGIMPEAVQNMLILDYGTEESLRIIKERANEIAAVLVEPVQSRRPEFQPVAFLKELRKITSDAGTVLVFDEVITGFRMHPGGAQALFGIKADIGTYGKVVGAGISIGVIAGKKYLMDALDGGYWQYGDSSIPEAGVTYFAGTFVRHPLALAAAKASLEYMKKKGPSLQQNITDKATRVANAMNLVCTKNKLPIFIAQFGSLWKIKFKDEIPYSELLFVLMREKGIHILDGFPCFTTEAHTDEEINLIIDKFEESVNEMMEVGFFTPTHQNGESLKIEQMPQQKKVEEKPPVDGARLGKDKNGNPAWFITDPQRPGKYLQLK